MKKLVLTGGGSAGHVVPNLALVPRLRVKFELFYIGTNGIERKLLAGKGIPFYTIDAPKLVRGSLMQNFSLPFRLLRSVRQAKKHLRSILPDAVFSKGGYVSLPVVLAARALKIPVLSHESDFSAGLANRIIAKRCKTVLTSFPETAKSMENGVYTGSPVREELFLGDHAAALGKYGFAGKKPVLLAFGGGSGSRTINDALTAALAQLLPYFDILHICGKTENAVRSEGYVPLEFEHDMASAYACADFVVARAGSNTVFELLALKKPALLIPLENKRSRGDQVENALYFQKRGVCHVLRESELTADTLKNSLLKLASDKILQRNLQSANFKAGNSAIIKEICDAAGNTTQTEK